MSALDPHAPETACRAPQTPVATGSSGRALAPEGSRLAGDAVRLAQPRDDGAGDVARTAAESTALGTRVVIASLSQDRPQAADRTSVVGGATQAASHVVAQLRALLVGVATVDTSPAADGASAAIVDTLTARDLARRPFNWVARAQTDDRRALAASAEAVTSMSVSPAAPDAAASARHDAFSAGLPLDARSAGDVLIAPVVGIVSPSGVVLASEPGPMAVTSHPAGVAQLGNDDPALVPQIVKAVHLQWRQGLGEARLRLDPPHLGELHVQLRVHDGLVSALVRAENPTVQGWIDARQQELRTALEEQGLRLAAFEVVVDPDGRREAKDGQPPPPRLRSPRRSDGTPRFEVNV